MSTFDLEAADLGEILARQEGVAVRRSGGLGSNATLSLNGLSGDQIRYFLDGVPLDVAGLPMGVQNVPPQLLGELVIYRGVVPAVLGSDALGGAIELRTRPPGAGSEVAANYQVGSFNTHRISAVASHRFDNDVFVKSYGFFDHSDNDYEVPNAVIADNGRDEIVPLERFNDAYTATGGSIEIGLDDHVRWGDLSVRGYASSTRRELQNDPFGQLPFGEAETDATVLGSTLRFDTPLGDRMSIDGVAGYAFARRGFEDLSTCVFNWSGECARIRERAGELDGDANDSIQRTQSLYLRNRLNVDLDENHIMRLSVSPTLNVTGGEERAPRRPDTRDSLEDDRRLISTVAALEHESRWWRSAVVNTLFAKGYIQRGRTESLDTAGENPIEDRFGTTTWGAGNAFGWTVSEALPFGVELSYEYATRLPNEAELFGTPGSTQPNTDLRPEQSHNLNAGFRLTRLPTAIGSFTVNTNVFLRDTTDLIRLEGAGLFFRFNNVVEARSFGAEGFLGWASPGERLELNVSATGMDFRNVSQSGPQAGFNGDRVPNQPYLFGSATLRFRFPSLLQTGDSLEFWWTTRYVHEYFLSWESIGDPTLKPTIDSQLPSSATLGYRFSVAEQDANISVEAQNIFDSTLFDFFGVQRPGRAFFIRMALAAWN